LNLNFKTTKKNKIIDLIKKRLNIEKIEEKKELYDNICKTVIKPLNVHNHYKINFNNVDKFNTNYYKIHFKYKIYDWKLKMLINLMEMLFLNFIVLIIEAQIKLEISDETIIKSISKMVTKKMLKILSEST
jgi:hypothetical protein